MDTNTNNDTSLAQGSSSTISNNHPSIRIVNVESLMADRPQGQPESTTDDESWDSDDGQPFEIGLETKEVPGIGLRVVRRRRANQVPIPRHLRKNECKVCRQRLDDDVQLWRHIRLIHCHDGDRYLSCPLKDCEKRFSVGKNLDTHLGHHRHYESMGLRDRLPQTCELCGILYDNIQSLFEHIYEQHQTAVPYTCGLCALIFGDIMTLGTHVRQRHARELQEPTNNLLCNVCGQVSSNELHLREHLLSH